MSTNRTSRSRFRTIGVLASLCALGAGVTSCAKPLPGADKQAASEAVATFSPVTTLATTSAATSAVATTTLTSSASSSTTSTAVSSAASSTRASHDPSATSSAVGAAASSSESSSNEPINAEVEQAYSTFKSLAPRSLFAQFKECSATGIAGNFNCSGPGIGQVQFFKSSAKAAQTTQVLTELRSSRVISDNGDRIVGWSTLGSTAILTVVDNSQNLVMQQMVSTDQVDPEKKLAELGLH